MVSPGSELNQNYLDEGHALSLVDLAQAVLSRLFSENGLGQLLDDSKYQPAILLAPAIRVNVTLRCGGYVRGSRSAPGKNLAEQVCLATIEAARDRRFGGALTRVELAGTSIEIWIQNSAKDLALADRIRPDAIVLGIDGVEIEGRGERAFHKPSFAIANGLSSPAQMFSTLCVKAGLQKEDWKSSDIRLTKTAWSCYHVDPQGQKSQLSGFRRQPEEKLNARNIPQWVQSACMYLVRNQHATGMIPYIYSPVKNHIPDRAMNRVRACGSLYALSRASQNPAVGDARDQVELATRNLAKALLAQTIPWGNGCRVVSERKADHAPKLGATALLSVAHSYEPLRTLYAGEAEELYRSILSAQKPDGRFITQFGVPEENLQSTNYYSGEAILALALRAERGDEVAAAACRASFQPYRDHFRAGRTTAFVGWHVDVWSRLAIGMKNEEYADFAFEQIDWLLRWQICEGNVPEWLGGFSEIGIAPGSSSIVFTEALLYALGLAHFTGDRERTARYTAATRLALTFCSKLRLAGIPDSFFPEPSRSEGGIAMSLSRKLVRCDVVQHFITMCLAAIASPVEIY